MLVILPFSLTFYWLLVHWKLRLKLNKHFWKSKYLDGKEALDHAVVAQMQRIAGVWQCLTCGWETKFKTRLFEHVEATHVQTNGYTCPYCDKFCPSKNSLKVHKSRNHKNEITNMYWIELHWIKVALGFNWVYLLTLLSGFYAQPSNVDVEVQSRIITVGKSEFQCAECGQTATIRSNMWRHIEAKHVSAQSISCQFCEKTCPSRNALASHVSRYHRYKDQWIEQKKSNLRTHMHFVICKCLSKLIRKQPFVRWSSIYKWWGCFSNAQSWWNVAMSCLWMGDKIQIKAMGACRGKACEYKRLFVSPMWQILSFF